MPIRDIFKVSRKTFLNPTGWLDYNSLAAQHRTIWSVLKDLFTTPTPAQEETFEEAIERLDLTEADVRLAAKRYRHYALFFLAIGALVFIYAFYLLFRYVSLTGWLLGMAASGLLLAQAFRYDFWSFQMRRRKLGATFAEWKKSILGDEGTLS